MPEEGHAENPIEVQDSSALDQSGRPVNLVNQRVVAQVLNN